MKIDGHYDRDADIAWLRFEGYDGSTVVSERPPGACATWTPQRGRWSALSTGARASRPPGELLAMLPAPPVGVAG